MIFQKFVLFSHTHLITMMVVFLITAALPLIFKSSSEKNKSIMAKIIACMIIIHVIFSPIKDLYLTQDTQHWKEVFPFHMCDLTEIFLALFLLGGAKFLYKISFFWGIGGSTMAIITPDVDYNMDLDYISFYIGHGMILVGIFYATFVLNNRPQLTDVGKVIFITIFMFLPIVFAINFLLGSPANYWYLMQKPDAATLLTFFPDWPFYLLITIPVAISIFYLSYLPYLLVDRINKNR